VSNPNTYSNRTFLVPNATIVLFDAINTAVADEAYARLEIIKLVEHLRPTDSLAICTHDPKVSTFQSAAGRDLSNRNHQCASHYELSVRPFCPDVCGEFVDLMSRLGQ